MSVYFVRFGPYIKVGTSTNPVRRVEQIQKNVTSGQRMTAPLRQRRDTTNPPLIGYFEPELLRVIPGGGFEESQTHFALRRHHFIGEWFHTSPELLARIADDSEWVAA